MDPRMSRGCPAIIFRDQKPESCKREPNLPQSREAAKNPRTSTISLRLGVFAGNDRAHRRTRTPETHCMGIKYH